MTKDNESVKAEEKAETPAEAPATETKKGKTEKSASKGKAAKTAAKKDKATAKKDKPAKADAKKGKAEKPAKAKKDDKKSSKPKGEPKPKKPAAERDQFGFRKDSKKSQAAKLYASKKGATLAEVKAATNSSQLNLLKELEEKGYTIEQTKVAGSGKKQVTRYKILTDKVEKKADKKAAKKADKK